MQGDIDRVLIDRQTIALRVEALAREITRDLGVSAAGGSQRMDVDAADEPDVTFIPILTGGFIFAADLIRHLPVKLKIRLISVSSYPGASTVSGGAQLRSDLSHLPATLTGSHAIVIDDILDSGNTLRLVSDALTSMRPATLRTCVLLRKQRPAALAFPVDYVAFDIPDEFVVGYGLDFNDHYRNLPDIVTLRPHVIEAAQSLPAPRSALEHGGSGGQGRGGSKR